MTDFTAEILSNERWYGDGVPFWHLGRPRSHKSSFAAAEQRQQWVKVLRRHGKGNASALALAVKLDACGPGHRCRSAACPECHRAYQRWFVTACYDLLELGRGSTRWKAVSVTPPQAKIRQGGLKGDLFQGVSKALTQGFDEANIAFAVGGFDISFNEHQQRAFKPHWKPHAWVFMQCEAFERGEGRLRATMPKTNTTPRPVYARDFDGHRAGLAYALKIDFKRRVSLPRVSSGNGAARSRRNTRERELRAVDKLELLLALDRAGLEARVYLRGARIKQSPTGPVIKRTALPFLISRHKPRQPVKAVTGRNATQGMLAQTPAP